MDSSPGPDFVRRPIAARNTRWASAMARRLAQAGLRPNHISVLSVVFAALAGACLLASPGGSPAMSLTLLFGAALGIQGRLLCNLFDGMVAVEGGYRTRSGEVFNDLPDRLSDPLILVPAGYATAQLPGAVELGWLAGLLAVLTAYVRVLGGSCGVKQRFLGPMAKQHRMAVLTVACLLSLAETALHWPMRALYAGLVIIVAGCLMTIMRRTTSVVRELESP
jgi:phosphatidylglycerophosphate synthase